MTVFWVVELSSAGKFQLVIHCYLLWITMENQSEIFHEAMVFVKKTEIEIEYQLLITHQATPI